MLNPGLRAMPSLWTQLRRYALTGVGATALHALVYLTATQRMQFEPLWANTAGYLVAMPFAFTIHHQWSFRHQTDGGTVNALPAMSVRFFTTNAFGYSLNALIVWLVCGIASWPAWSATPFMASITPLATFMLNRNWVFRVTRPSPDPQL
ncbi:GtrA family protein [Parapedomonas caeni]